MNRPTVHFSTDAIDYAHCPLFGPDHILNGIASEAVEGFPLLRKKTPPPAVAGQDEPLYIIGGQQPGLLTGPLYTVLKAATAVHLSRSLSKLWHRPVLPCFWNASEDHDIMEVNRTLLGGRKLVCPYKGPLKRGEVPPVGSIGLAEHRRRIIDAATDAYGGEPFFPMIAELLEKSSYENYGAFFGALMHELFKPWDLRIVEPTDLREQTSPILATLVENWSETENAFRRGIERVKKAGFDPPLASLTFFELVNGKRIPVPVYEHTFTLSSGACSGSEAAAEIRKRPHDFSPGAALRPVLQDAALPTCVTVAGPSEILYLWQIRDIHGVAGITPSLLFPRLSATFVDRETCRRIEAAGRSLPEMFPLVYTIETQLDTLSSPEIETIESSFDELMQAMKQAETPANAAWFSRSRRSLAKSFKKTAARLRREQVAPEGELKQIREALFPRNRLQERTAGVFDFLARYGHRWLEHACSDLDPWTIDHKLVAMNR